MRKQIWLALFILICPMRLFAINIPDYLIDSDIGEYSKSYPGACPKGSGVVAATGHFKTDHTDYACDIRYYNESIDLGVEVQVTQHSGSDSDKWLLHELDMDFRNYYGIPGQSYSQKQIDGQVVLEDVVGGRNYRWVSGNKVITIEYHDSMLTKLQPMEIVKAYLIKHPSTLTPMGLAELRNDTNKTKWIQDEMDRRLWLCDKWVGQKEAGKVDVNKLLTEMQDHMKVFLNYKEKYYGIASIDEKNTIYGYMQAKDEAAMKTKLAEYKAWWAANKDGAINLP